MNFIKYDEIFFVKTQLKYLRDEFANVLLINLVTFKL